MCGRYALFGPVSRKRSDIPPEPFPKWRDELLATIDAMEPRYNLAPTDVGVVVGVTKGGDVEMRSPRWGLVPYWAKDTKIGAKAINARAETVAEKPMFREAFKKRRCLVPARGYFEWKGEPKHKQPFFIHSPDEPLLLFAGLWEGWRDPTAPEGEWLHTYTIVTGPPGIVSGDIHDRAPVILSSSQWETWLRGEADAAAEILANAVEPELAYYPVPKAVGSPRNDTPDLVEQIEIDQ